MIKWPWKEKEKDILELEINRLTLQLKDLDPLDEEYQTVTRRLTELSEVDAKRKQSIKKEKLSPNAVAGGVIGLIELFAIMTYEKSHVLATKAFSRIMRGRV